VREAAAEYARKQQLASRSLSERSESKRPEPTMEVGS
jgi:hypothetical protein